MATSVNISIARDLQPVETSKNKENIRLIWLDANIDDSSDSMNSQTLLLEFNPAAQFYTDPIRCVNVIKSIQQEQILLIISGALARDVLPQIHGLRILIAVFVFCRNRAYHVKLMSEYSKIVDVFTAQEELLQSLRNTMDTVEKQMFAFSLFDQKQKSTRDLSKDSASFLCHQLLIHVLKRMPQDDHAKNDLLTTCSSYYAMNKKELKKIKEFRLSYSREKAIQWYTDECFLYKLLNKAIRTEDIELLYAFRFYIIDLCDALENESKKLKAGSILTLYRGQQIPNDEFEKLRKHVGTLISTNGFLSTSRSIDVALEFARRFRATNDMKTCIFEIRANPSMSAAVFADIDKYSRMKDEQEVLFGLNATFKIDCVKMDNTLKMWKVYLSTTAEGTSRIEQYMKLQEDEMKLSSPLIAFGKLLLNELGQINRAGNYYEKLLRSLPPNHPDIHFVHNNIGNVYGQKGELNLALKHYEEAYRLRRSTFPADHPCIAASLHNIGLIYKDKNDFNRALEYLRQSLTIMKKNYSGDHSHKCHALLNIGVVHHLKGELDDALIWLNRALDMYRRVRPAAHPDTAYCLGQLGSIYEDKNNLDLAIEFYRRRLEMEEECLPLDHPNLSTHLDRLAKTYKKKCGKQVALDFCQIHLASQKEALGESHPRIASTLMTMGDICHGEKTLRYYENALSVLENYTPRNELLTIECLEMLGAIALDGGKTGEGIGHWKYVLDISRQSLSSDHPKIAERLESLGDAYFEAMYDYEEALRYFTESLAIYRKNYGDQHTDIINLEKRIGKVYEKLKEQQQL